MKSFTTQTPTAYRFLLQFVVLVVCWAYLQVAPAWAATRYVKPTATGTGDGSSWANASADLQGMINASAAADEVWVAAGTYKPAAYPTGCTGCSTNRDYAFHLKNGVKLYGGFAGTETAVSQRNISANPTILSGDFNGNDVVTGSGSTLSITGNTENALHVVLSISDDATTILDGFMVSGGNANGSGSITVESILVFKNNGGGMYNISSSPTITNTIFSDNAATNVGGGMYNSISSPTITNTTFSGNTATNGGGMYNYFFSSPTITNTIFSGNTAVQGGGMYNYISSSPTITNTTFSGNTANNGGGMYNESSSSPNIRNSILWGNGTEIANVSSSNPTVSFSIVQGGYTGATNANPLFVNPANPAGTDGIHRTADDGLRLQAGSPAINAGSNALIPSGITTDITGLFRILNGIVDIGAYENLVCPASTTLYVDASVANTGNGETWASAFKTLDEALYVAWNCPDVNRINVATGAYIPSRKPYNTDGSEMTTTDNRDKTFHLRNGVAMYGGYPAGGSATQDVAANPTILSGDFNGNDVVTGSGSTLSITGNTENALHVVLSISDDATTILDGFMVSGGNANGSGSITVESILVFKNNGGGMYNISSSPSITNTTFSGNAATYGGGMFNYSSSPTITNATFSGNTAAQGGGMFNRDSSPTITNTTFSGNTATNGSGGGMYNDDSNPTITNTTFSGNAASSNGGGMYNDYSSSPNITNTTFSGNAAINSGGGMFNGSSSPNITNTTFSGNAANQGGGMYNYVSSSPTITNATFSGNSASSGGGMYNYSSSPTITNATFSGNAATNSGGGMYNYFTSPSITNTTFSGNSATNGGGGMYNYFGSSPSITNTTFSGNSATNGGGMCNDGSSPTIRNSILWGNGTEIVNGFNSNPTVSFSIVQGGYTGATNANPLFVNPANPAGPDGIHRTADDGLRLQAGSPALNAGSNAHIPTGITTDITGADRIQGGTVDMGAYERYACPTATTLYVDASVATTGNGDTWATAFKTLDEALFAAWNCPDVNRINVATGAYIPSRKPYNTDGSEMTTTDNRDKTFHLRNGVAMYGGYPAGGSATQDVAANPTILSGDFNGDDVVTGSGSTLSITGNGENAYHVVLSISDDETTVLDGFTVRGGNADGNGGITVEGITITNYFGGGIVNRSSSPTITNATFFGNAAAYYGGGIGNLNSSPSITNAIFSGNAATNDGGGMFNANSSPSITNATFSGNAANSGGGMHNHLSSPTISNATFLDNVAEQGGGMYNYDYSSPTITNANFLDNAATYNGGGMYNFSSSPIITNATFSGNSANGSGGGMYNYFGSSPTTTNATFSGNTATNEGGGMYNSNSSPTITNATFSGNVVTYSGGGMCNLVSSSPNITNTTFSGNAALIGGGLYNELYSSPIISNATFFDNVADAGGGMYNFNFSSPSITNVIFSENTATNDGGGMYNNNYSLPTISDATFSDNSAIYGGGMYNINTSSPSITNTTFSGNTANQGGGMYNDNESSPTITNATFSGNAADQGGGMFNYYYSSPSIRNSILWGNGTEIANLFDSNPTVSFSIVQGGYTGATNANPLFVNPANPAGPDGIHRTADDGLRLQAGSPAINAGSNALIPSGITTDITGADRIMAGTVDMGAYESACITNTTTVTACGSYTWAVNGQTYTQPGIYTVQVTDCLTEILDLTIPPGLVVSLNGNTNVCAGGVIGLIATGGNQYQWSGPNGYSATGGSITRTNATVAMSGAYTVTITNNECSTVLSITVTVHPIPNAAITGATSVCSGGTIGFSVPAGAVGYAWTGPAGFTAATNAIALPNATTGMSGTYKVTVTGAGGCTASGSRTVSVNAPTAAAITGATSVCAGTTLTLTATTAGVGYAWSGPGGFSFSGATMTRTPAVAGTYTVTVTNASGCISTASRTVTLNAAPNVVVTNNSNCTRIWLVASGGNSYTWSGPNGYTVTGATVLRNPATASMFGVYTVTVTGNGGCTASASITVNPCSGKTQSLPPDLSLSAYPNPTPGIVHISFTNVEAEEVMLAIYTADGKEVNTLFTGIAEAYTNYTLRFDGSYLPNGVYYAVLRRAGTTEQLPIMVVR